MQSLKQKWVFRRCYANKGTLTAMLMNIRSLISDESTIRDEVEELKKIQTSLVLLLADWDDRIVRKISLANYKKRWG